MTQKPAPGPTLLERELDLRYYADVLWRGRFLVVATAAVGLALALLVAQLQTAQYRAVTLLQIDPPTPTFLRVTDALVGGGSYWQHADFYNTQFKILRSRTVGQRVVERLKLGDTPGFAAGGDAATTLLAHVRVEPVPESRLVQVQVTHSDAETAALWANTLAEVYIERSIETRVDAARGAYEWLQDRLAATQKAMQQAQERLFKSYQGQDLFVPEGSVSAVTSSITKLNEDHIATQSRLIELNAALKQLREMRDAGKTLDAVPQVAEDGLMASLRQRLATLHLDLTRLRGKFKDAHPEIQRVQAQLAEVRRERVQRTVQIEEGLAVERAQLKRRDVELKAAVDRQKGLAADQSRKVSELDALRKEADSAKGLYEVLLQKLNESDIAASITSNNVSLVERAIRPRAPSSPNKRRITSVGLLLGLVLGVALVFVGDYLDNTLKDPDEVERYLHLDLLAAVPHYEDAQAHLVTEAYQNLRTALIFGRRDDRGQVVLITGTAPQEGKTTTLINIARLMAASGERTVALDFDLRRAQVHSRLGLSRQPGVTDVFTRHQQIDALVQETAVPNLFAVTAGALPPNPPALLARKDLNDLLDQLRARFEWIVVDSPPLASVTDALLLARHADMVVVVIQHNKVDKRLVKRCLAGLRKAGANVLGVILNAVDAKAKGYQGYYQYYYRTHEISREEVRPEEWAAHKPLPEDPRAEVDPPA